MENRHSLSLTLKSLLNKKPTRSEYWQEILKHQQLHYGLIYILKNSPLFLSIKLIIISKLTLVKDH